MTVTSSSERYRFAGHERDQRTGYDYMHARYYAPMAGRFFSVDPVRGDPAQPQSLNLYAYVRGNPINFVDPWGLKDQGAMSPASTSDEWQRDGVCTNVMSDPDCWNEQITVTAKAPRIDLQQIADAHDAKVLQEWLQWRAYTNSAYALRTARYAGQVVPTDPMASWQHAAYDPQDPMVQILGQVASTTQPWIELGESYMVSVATLIFNPVFPFARGGRAWHVGLELAGKRNVIHLGRHPRYGIHVALGYVGRNKAWLHLYFKKEMPFIRLWWPGMKP